MRTPDRVTRSLNELTAGYEMTVEEVVGTGVFHEDCSDVLTSTSFEARVTPWPTSTTSS